MHFVNDRNLDTIRCSRIRKVVISKAVSMNLHFVLIITNYESLMPFFAFSNVQSMIGARSIDSSS